MRTCNVSGQNELIYAGEKRVCVKINNLLKKPNREGKPGRESRLEIQIKKLRRQAYQPNKEEHVMIYWDRKTQTKRHTSLIIQLEYINYMILVKEE